ncbi:Zinc finger, C2H2 domain and Zinc finger C2H2-type/integrase DNA-binding domain and Zinc finger, C2H2-like domain-containing protein [Strongyloides ratti]|uniref:Zinc finger, C2H2 domain and Zinc finger C2H2-type/integrase DNA-binding domain and Zinc finger, C2H2-like domain-containing protein n=1 Tax=Strongyloides ratti TaxID=34506 RepID=A0A090LA11_STRRB|nr:Zinc finger, C2H2 domain and Zinc finger C2H2-type/integrase DNA-binding domain and Zinc finger, C2H2-like domain-containing protein [Strongyloides ratti]CEF64340.1 Zinc finger, C2H2 domain and Zinc finger C2H2-type/integrase DNA-binding domain and Zinc finger, C2H2-like domain-containing protein [Strongyloides ratti]
MMTNTNDFASVLQVLSANTTPKNDLNSTFLEKFLSSNDLSAVFSPSITKSGTGSPEIKFPSPSNELSLTNKYFEMWQKASYDVDKNNMNGFTFNLSYLDSGVNGILVSNLKCSQCDVVKTTTENLEIHMKVEHLNWLPFECPMCNAIRASDNQMREHFYSSHKQTGDRLRFHYNDNPEAKRLLQFLMDRSLFAASKMHHYSMKSPTSSMLKESLVSYGAAIEGTTTSIANNLTSTTPSTNILSSNGKKEKKRKCAVNNLLMNKMSKMAGGGTTDSVDGCSNNELPSRKKPAASDIGILSQEFILAQIANGPVLSSGDSNSVKLEEEGDKEKSGDKGEDDYVVLNDQTNGFAEEIAQYNISNFLNGSSKKIKTENESDIFSSDIFSSMTSIFKKNHTNVDDEKDESSKSASSKFMAKKRVIGLCSRCKKPVTAGSRQTHIFYHLSKDFGQNRFQCRYEGCDAANYRKDQLEAHLQKKHNTSNPDMILDRSQELNSALIDLSIELLGTSNNTPGPTASEGQKLYDLQRLEVGNVGKGKKSKKNGDILQLFSS